eukprot:COSAG06_NODE_106_length_23773_cov_20.279083_7_plen_145_part_00
MMLILSVYRRMLYSWANARAGKWRAGLSTENVLELSGKTIGIVGFGNVGRQLARKASGFDVRIIYHDIDELMPGRDLELGATAVSLCAHSPPPIRPSHRAADAAVCVHIMRVERSCWRSQMWCRCTCHSTPSPRPWPLLSSSSG